MHGLSHWAGILAGGNGTRLHEFTKALTGDDRPKQFCRLLGRHTLVGATRARLSSLVEPERTLCVVTRHHAGFYTEELADLPSYALIEQPVNRGTTAAIAYLVARVASIAPNAVLAMFPADHHYEDASVLRQTTAMAYAAAAIDRRRIFMVGAEPDRPEPEYGYIEQGAMLPQFSSAMLPTGPIRAVTRFVEKPSPVEAAALLRRGCLWNTFVLVGHVEAFTGLLDETVPGLYREFLALWSQPDEAAAAAMLYEELAPSDFSKEILARCPDRLGVLSLPSGNWTDLGQPSRVLEVMAARRQSSAALVAS
jgi:mannose-1-phosphate guanylyltransferase